MGDNKARGAVLLRPTGFQYIGVYFNSTSL